MRNLSRSSTPWGTRGRTARGFRLGGLSRVPTATKHGPFREKLKAQHSSTSSTMSMETREFTPPCRDRRSSSPLTVTSTRYYDPGNFVNYQISRVTRPTATSASATLPAGRREPVNPSNPPAITPPNVPPEEVPRPPLGCESWNGLDRCNGSGYVFSPSAEKRRWQTPPKGGEGYVATFQDYRDLVGYADIQYSFDRKRGVVVVNAASRTGESLTYYFNGAGQSSNAYQVSSELNSDSLEITVVSQGGKTLVLEPLNFIWQNAALTTAQSTFSGGQKGGIVELFGWPYNDVSKECTFIGKAGA